MPKRTTETIWQRPDIDPRAEGLAKALVEHETKRPAGKIDMTPTWRGVLPILLAGIENGTPESRKIAIEELQKMADAADLYNASISKNAD